MKPSENLNIPIYTDGYAQPVDIDSRAFNELKRRNQELENKIKKLDKKSFCEKTNSSMSSISKLAKCHICMYFLWIGGIIWTIVFSVQFSSLLSKYQEPSQSISNNFRIDCRSSQIYQDSVIKLVGGTYWQNLDNACVSRVGCIYWSADNCGSLNRIYFESAAAWIPSTDLNSVLTLCPNFDMYKNMTQSISFYNCENINTVEHTKYVIYILAIVGGSIAVVVFLIWHISICCCCEGLYS